MEVVAVQKRNQYYLAIIALILDTKGARDIYTKIYKVLAQQYQPIAMKTFLILRHAKSVRKAPSLSDHDRPLDKLGEKDALRMGKC